MIKKIKQYQNHSPAQPVKKASVQNPTFSAMRVPMEAMAKNARGQIVAKCSTATTNTKNIVATSILALYVSESLNLKVISTGVFLLLRSS